MALDEGVDADEDASTGAGEVARECGIDRSLSSFNRFVRNSCSNCTVSVLAQTSSVGSISLDGARRSAIDVKDSSTTSPRTRLMLKKTLDSLLVDRKSPKRKPCGARVPRFT